VTRLRRIALAGLLALSALWAGGAAVAAHALLISSDPAANAVLATAPSSVSATFTEPPDPRLSSLHVLDVAGTDRTTGPVTVSGPSGATLTVPVGPLPSGVYTVAWRTVSTADGHTAAGSFAFSVGTGAPPSSGAAGAPGSAGSAGASGGAGTSSVSPGSVLARAVMYLGLVVLLGSLVAGEALLGERARRANRLRAVAWLAAVVGSFAVLVTQAGDAGVSIADALDSSLGTDLLLRLAPLAGAGIALVVASRRARWRRPASWAAGALVALALLADAAASHAATVAAPWLGITLQWLHAVGIAVWLGGLAGVLVELRDPEAGDRARLVRGFSRWATAGILLVAVTGVLRAASELHNPGELASTDYGRLLLVKLGLFAGLALLGAFNHFRNVPAGAGGVRSVRRLGSVELLLGTTAIVVASVLVTTPPPADSPTGAGASGAGGTPPAAPAPAASSGPASATVTGSDYATTVKMQLTITPSSPGPASYVAEVTDYDTGAPVPATGVSLRFALPSRPDVGASSLALQPAGGGTFTGSGSNLSLAGIWSVTATVAEATTAVEVPMTVIAAPAPLGVDVNRVTGQPTLYSVHLNGGDQAQLYLDPFGPGTSTLHITYFDPAGQELPVSDIRVEAAQAGSAPSSMPMSPIEPGHATARVPTTAGVPIDLLVTATAPNGGTILFPLTITPDP
jgi:copper transport protein